MTKYCGKCRRSKDTKEYNKHPKKHDGLQSWCRLCSQKYKNANRRAKTERDYFNKYKLLPGDYEKMFDAQGGMCAICWAPPGKKGLYVDHDHSTGRNRGLLCNHCNLLLGHGKDSPARLQAAITYLQRAITERHEHE